MIEKTPITFKPKQIVKRLLSVLGDRSRDVLISRFGLGNDTKRLTLEAIGKKYKITRERVRQIENYSVINIRKSKEYTKERPIFDELRNLIAGLGSTISEFCTIKSTHSLIVSSGSLILKSLKTFTISEIQLREVTKVNLTSFQAFNTS